MSGEEKQMILEAYHIATGHSSRKKTKYSLGEKHK